MKTTSFSLAFVTFREYLAGGNGPLLGVLDRAVLLEAPGAAPEIIPTMGGASQWPSAAREGRRSGESKLTANQCPMWAKQLGMGGSLSVSGPAATATASAVSDVAGNTMSKSLVATPTAGSLDAAVSVEITAAAQNPNPAKARVTIYSSNGEEEVIEDFAIPAAVPIAPNLASIGVALSRAVAGANTPAFVVGDTGFFMVYAARAKRETLKIGNNPRMKYVTIEGRTVAVDGDDFTGTLKIAKARVTGFTPKDVDNEATNGMELNMTICAVPGGYPLELIHDHPA